MIHWTYYFYLPEALEIKLLQKIKVLINLLFSSKNLIKKYKKKKLIK